MIISTKVYESTFKVVVSRISYKGNRLKKDHLSNVKGLTRIQIISKEMYLI